MALKDKHKDTRFRVGALCERCGKGKYEKASCNKQSKTSHKNHIICKTCKLTNF